MPITLLIVDDGIETLKGYLMQKQEGGVFFLHPNFSFLVV